MIGILFFIGIAIWLTLAVMISKRIPRWVGITKHTTAVSMLAFPLVLIAPLADEVVGNIYMENVLCSNANELVINKSIDSVKKARAIHVPSETIWFGIPIEKLQVDYIDLDTNEVFAYSKNYITHGGWLMRLGLNLGNFGSCGRWATETRYYSGSNSTSMKLEQLLKTGEPK